MFILGMVLTMDQLEDWIKNKISQGYMDFAIIGAKPKETLEKINPKSSRVPRKLYIVYRISENVEI